MFNTLLTFTYPDIYKNGNFHKPYVFPLSNMFLNMTIATTTTTKQGTIHSKLLTFVEILLRIPQNPFTTLTKSIEIYFRHYQPRNAAVWQEIKTRSCLNMTVRVERNISGIITSEHSALIVKWVPEAQEGGPKPPKIRNCI